MNKGVSISASMPPTWSLIKDIQNSCSEYLSEHEVIREDSDSILMVVRELVENAVKYGSRALDGTCLDFYLVINDSTVDVSVKNGVKNLYDFSQLSSTIDSINGSDSAEMLYRARLFQIYEAPVSEKSCLGLFRIAYEGEFSLDYRLRGDLLGMRAWRTISGSNQIYA